MLLKPFHDCIFEHKLFKTFLYCLKLHFAISLKLWRYLHILSYAIHVVLMNLHVFKRSKVISVNNNNHRKYYYTSLQFIIKCALRKFILFEVVFLSLVKRRFLSKRLPEFGFCIRFNSFLFVVVITIPVTLMKRDESTEAFFDTNAVIQILQKATYNVD